MPGRNIYKDFAADQYYHAYSRGVAKQKIFLDKQDYTTFLGLLKRYLSTKSPKSRGHGTYPNYGGRLQVLSYCLMPNHIHLLLYQEDETAMTEFMKSLMISYSMYFNRKCKRVGPVFQSRYRASRISSDSYLNHISRYIHLNPKSWRTYRYSSIRYFDGTAQADWIRPDKILDLFPSKDKYLEFVKDYEDHKAMLDELRWELADQ